MTVGDMIKELGRYPRDMEIRLVVVDDEESREIEPEDVILDGNTVYIYEENAGPER